MHTDIVLAVLFALSPMRPTVNSGDEPAPTPPTLPQPALVDVVPETIIMDLPPILPYERINRYDVWQYMGVDRMGRWRPRVIHSPVGAYYLYNGAPYPFTVTHTLDFMPYAN